jgi:alanine dehydrogenase
MMIIGVPKEIKNHEYRVALTAASVRELVEAGHQVLVETEAGAGCRIADDEYRAVGARIVATQAEAWDAEMVVKVKEPQAEEYRFLRADQILFTFLHLAADEPLTRAMAASGVTGIAYETVELANGSLPILTPMSEIAGRMAVQVGARLLEAPSGGRGKLMGGVAGVLPADVVIIGAGVVGVNAARIALGMGARVTVLDTNIDRLRHLEDTLAGRLITLSSNSHTIDMATRNADLLIGAVLLKGARAPMLVSRAMIANMLPGSVVVDVAVDQGGCIETSHPTTHANPTFLVDEVVHYCVANMPGAVPRTSIDALNNVTLPYISHLAKSGFQRAVNTDPALAAGVNTYAGEITYAAVAEVFHMEYVPLAALLPNHSG